MYLILEIIHDYLIDSVIMNFSQIILPTTSYYINFKLISTKKFNEIDCFLNM